VGGLSSHFIELGSLEVEELEEVVGEGVDLIGDRGQALRRVPLRLVQGLSLVVNLEGI
jgi:hypothetical protein